MGGQQPQNVSLILYSFMTAPDLHKTVTEGFIEGGHVDTASAVLGLAPIPQLSEMSYRADLGMPQGYNNPHSQVPT